MTARSWVGTITVGRKPDGRRDRLIVRGRTKTEVTDKLHDRHTELAAGVRRTINYTVEQCLKDWLETLNTQAEITCAPPGRAGWGASVAAGAGILGVVGHYSLSASTRRSMSSSMLPVLGSSRLASMSLSSALGRPS